MLIDSADVNARRVDNGMTVLMWGASSGNVDVVQQLLVAGADPQTVNHAGSKAIDLAREKGHAEVVALLERQVSVESRGRVK